MKTIAEETVNELMDLVTLEEVGRDLFVGASKAIGTPNLYGGQVLAQGLAAASRSVDADRTAHSLHGYFLLPGLHQDVEYEVVRIRDGRSFSTRRVVARQEGKEIFEMSASFHVSEAGVQHQFEMPDVPVPEALESESVQLQRLVNQFPDLFRGRSVTPLGIEYRRAQPFDFLDPKPHVGPNSTWLRARAPLPDDPHLHRTLLTYAADHGLLMTPMTHHGLSFVLGQVVPASLDHAMWFHRDFRFDDWLLYHTDSPVAANARGFCRGSFYTRDGTLVASAVQEGVMRIPSMKGER